MKRLVLIGLLIAGIITWYVSWHESMKPHVARIEKTITHLNEQYKNPRFRATIEYNDIHASGFPFAKNIIIDMPKLNMIEGTETYSVSVEQVQLSFEDDVQGRYKLQLPAQANALYAIQNSAPEQYSVSANNVPQLWVRVQDDPNGCRGNCPAPEPEANLTQVGFIMPGNLTLTASLNGKTRQIEFRSAELPVPIFIAIPQDITRPLSLFVGMLREALVFTP